MEDIKIRLQQLEDRQQVQDVITNYLVAVDDLSSVDEVLDCFTDDAVFDMSGIDYPVLEGIDNLRDFFTNVFSSMTHHAHYATNFKLDQLENDTAACRTHVIGMGITKDGDKVLFYLQYHLRMKRTNSGWKMSNFRGQALMPLDS